MPVSSKTAGWVLFVLLAVYYFINRYPGLAFIDSGELALSSYTLGVPHPTGYPLYLILSAPASWLFSRPITGVTILAGLINAMAGMAFFHLMVAVKRRFSPDSDHSHIIAALATLILFLAPVVAAQGVGDEVYGLSLLVNLLALTAAVRAGFTNRQSRHTNWLILAWYLAGLTLCDHMSGVQLLPGLVFITFLVMRRRFSIRIMLICALAFILPLTLYAVLPLRAAANPPPVADWGDVTTWDNFIRHVSGWQFQVWMFTGDISRLWANTKGLAGILFDQFPVVILPLTAVGLYYLGRHAAKLLILILLIAAVNIGLGINYNIPDIDSYYLMTMALSMLLAVFGLYYLIRLIRCRYIGPVVMVLLLAWQALAVGGRNYKGDYTLPEDYALNIGRSAEHGAVILTEIWDHQSPAFYLQQAEGIRPDLRFVDKELLRRSWYYKTIANVYPELYAKIADLTPVFLNEIKVFEARGNYNAQVLETSYQAIINRLLTRCGPAYIDFRLSYTPHGDHYLRPQGVLYRVDTVRIETPLPQPHLIWRGRPLSDYTDPRALVHVKMIRKMESYWQ